MNTIWREPLIDTDSFFIITANYLGEPAERAGVSKVDSRGRCKTTLLE
jgi:homoserine acetyltransferase